MIGDIFQGDGEEGFRDLESALLRDLESVEKTVISAGGGLVLRPENVESLRTHSLIVCLWATPDSVYERVKTQSHRPLLQTADPRKTVLEMVEKRAPIYRAAADVLISTEFRSAMDVAAHVERQFREGRRVQASP